MDHPVPALRRFAPVESVRCGALDIKGRAGGVEGGGRKVPGFFFPCDNEGWESR